MLETFGQVLPLAAAIALSPFPVIAVVLVLGTPDASKKGLAFAAGWLVGLTTLVAAVVFLFDRGASKTSDESTLSAWLTLAFGVGLLVLAVRKWRSRPRAGEEPELPGWMAGINEMQPGKAAVLGLTLAGANPKNIAISFAASTVIADADLSVSGTAVEALVFVLLSSAVVIGAVVMYLVGGTRTASALQSLESFMLQNNAVIMMLILLLFGVKLVGDGLAGI